MESFIVTMTEIPAMNHIKPIELFTKPCEVKFQKDTSFTTFASTPPASILGIWKP